MAASVVLPIELMKLRRRIGDLYSESGTELTTANVLSVDGSQFKYLELLDTYNQAINSYLDYLVSVKPKHAWSSFAPGYVVLQQNKGTSPITKLNLEGLSPVPFRIIDMMKYTGTTPDDVFTEIKPDEWFSDIAKVTNVRANAYKYCLMSDGTNWSAFINPSLTGTIDLIYLKRHTDLTTGAQTTDFDNYFSPAGLQGVLIFGEIEAKRARSTSPVDSPEARLKNMTDIDGRIR